MKVEIGKGAIHKIACFLKDIGVNEQLLMVADNNTWAAAGQDIEKALSGGGFRVKYHVFDRKNQLRPDEEAVESVLKFAGENEGILLAVGSGTINDLVRHAANMKNKQYISAATAPSMDGYASVISALTVNRVKKTFYGKPPLAIIADTEVIAKAPRNMVMAGFGDMLAKFVSIADWKLGIALMDEQWSAEAATLSIEARDKVIQNTKKISSADIDGIHALTEALINSGTAIIIAGQTRPASGAEHHFAHYIEMKLALEERPEILHGVKVGLGTLCSIAFFNSLRNFDPESMDIDVLSNKLPDIASWEQNIRSVFGTIADEVLGETDLRYRDKKILKDRLKDIKTKWNNEIKPIIDEVPDLSEILKLIESAGFNYAPESMGLSEEEVKTALLFAMEVRPRYTVLRLLNDLGLLQKQADEIVNKLCR